MKKVILFSLGLFFVFSSCKNKENSISFTALGEGLPQYAEMIKKINDDIYYGIKIKVHEPMSAAKASIWFPKATAIKNLRDSLTAFVDELRAGLKRDTGTGDGRDAVELLFEKQGKATELYRRLMDFKENTLAVLNPDEFNDNPILKADIIKTQGNFRAKFPIHKESPVAVYFKNLSIPGAMAMLNKIQTDIEVIEGMMLDFINGAATTHLLICEPYIPLVMQNSSHFKKGDQLEVNIGVCDLNYGRNPTISINGEKIALNDQRVAVYKKRITEKAGTYSVSLRMEFYQPDGNLCSMTKKIEYIVSE